MSCRFPYFRNGARPFPGLELVLSSPRDPNLQITIAAKVDCGADRTIIPAFIVDQLELQVVEDRIFEGADGHIFTLPMVLVDFHVSGQPKRKILVASSDGESMTLLGLDLLRRLRITLDGPNQTLEIG